MVVPRAPRPPIAAPKPKDPEFDPAEVERWIGRLARAIRLQRREQRFLGVRQDADHPVPEQTLNPTDGDIVPKRR
jgi:hypothetical protein